MVMSVKNKSNISNQTKSQKLPLNSEKQISSLYRRKFMTFNCTSWQEPIYLCSPYYWVPLAWHKLHFSLEDKNCKLWNHKSSGKNSIIFELGTVRLQILNFLIAPQLIPLHTDFYFFLGKKKNEEYTEEVVHKR